jgi:hypothetical protein
VLISKQDADGTENNKRATKRRKKATSSDFRDGEARSNPTAYSRAFRELHNHLICSHPGHTSCRIAADGTHAHVPDGQKGFWAKQMVVSLSFCPWMLVHCGRNAAVGKRYEDMPSK